MQFRLLVYTDADRLDALPADEFDRLMRGCFEKADGLRTEGRLLASQQLEPPTVARTVRVRDGAMRVIDGPFAETKEVLAGFNLVEADSLEQAVAIAQQVPWSRFGSIEVRPVLDMERVRQRVGAS